MQHSKIKFIITFVLVFTLTFTLAVFSDSKDGWKGYGLFNISGSNISIISEDVDVELINGKLFYNGEFLIRNYSSDTVRTSLGMPVQGIEEISLTEKANVLKWKKRSYSSLQNEFGLENRIPQENSWYVFNLSLNPGESKLLNVRLEAALLQDAQNSYSFTYYNDRKLGFSNKVEKTSLYIDISNFEPYNIIELQGVEPSQLGKKGDIMLKGDIDSIDTVAIKYMDVTKVAANKMIASAMYKPRDIALTFLDKGYSRTSALCDEYLQNPNDTGLSQEQFQFFKAESLRRLQNYDKYLSIVEYMDYSKLSPAELKNKIFMDRMAIYLEQQSHEKLAALYEELEQETSESTQILKGWIENSSIYGAAQLDKDNLFKQMGQEEKKADQYKSQLEQWYKIAMEYKYTPAITFAAGLLLGLTFRFFRFRRKKKRSMYIYRM